MKQKVSPEHLVEYFTMLHNAMENTSPIQSQMFAGSYHCDVVLKLANTVNANIQLPSLVNTSALHGAMVAMTLIGTAQVTAMHTLAHSLFISPTSMNLNS